eukprot:g38866.t1
MGEKVRKVELRLIGSAMFSLEQIDGLNGQLLLLWSQPAVCYLSHGLNRTWMVDSNAGVVLPRPKRPRWGSSIMTQNWRKRKEFPFVKPDSEDHK